MLLANCCMPQSSLQLQLASMSLAKAPWELVHCWYCLHHVKAVVSISVGCGGIMIPSSLIVRPPHYFSNLKSRNLIPA